MRLLTLLLPPLLPLPPPPLLKWLARALDWPFYQFIPPMRRGSQIY
jgi:hypothetical protein